MSASVGRDHPTVLAADIAAAAVDGQTVPDAGAAFVSVVLVASAVDLTAPPDTLPGASCVAAIAAYLAWTDASVSIRAAERVFAAASVHSVEPFFSVAIENHNRAASSSVPVPVLEV